MWIAKAGGASPVEKKTNMTEMDTDDDDDNDDY
jgi:hypothetical protein